MSGSGQDAGDKGIFKAISGAQKYALMKAFMIPTGDDPEQDAGVDERNNRQSNPKANGKSKKLSEAQVKRLYAIAKNNGHTTADVKKAIMKLYKKTNAEDLTKAEYDTLISRIEASQQSEKRTEQPPVKTLPDGSVDPDDPSFPF